MNLTRTHRYERFLPNLGDNLESDRPFYLLISSGLSKQDFEDLTHRLTESKISDQEPDLAVKTMVEVLGDTVRMGDEPLTVNGGAPIATLADYFALTVFGIQGGIYHWLEVISALRQYNSLVGARDLFYERLSGGFTSTPAQRTAKAVVREVEH